LLLLEVDRLPAEAQRALAGVLSIRELNLRTLATARRRLVDLASQGEFREDLAFSLSTLEILLPPLASRPDDVPVLAQYFLERCNATCDKQLSGFKDEALERLVSYDWPGNLDELDSAITQAFQVAEGPWVEATDLPERLEYAALAAKRPAALDESIELDAFLEQVELELFRRAIRRAKGNKSQVARMLGIPRARVIRRMQHFGL
jgi:two-component system response regulator HydG